MSGVGDRCMGYASLNQLQGAIEGRVYFDQGAWQPDKPGDNGWHSTNARCAAPRSPTSASPSAVCMGRSSIARIGSANCRSWSTCASDSASRSTRRIWGTGGTTRTSRQMVLWPAPRRATVVGRAAVPTESAAAEAAAAVVPLLVWMAPRVRASRGRRTLELSSSHGGSTAPNWNRHVSKCMHVLGVLTTGPRS